MSFAHLTLPTTDVERTARLLEDALGWKRAPLPPNSPIEVVWLDLGRGQTVHVFHAPGFQVSAFEGEFGRHFAVFHPLAAFTEAKRRLLAAGATVYPAERATPFERFFFREPVNGYVIEVIDAAREGLVAEK
jgi:catechol 2,3-dioxygenase-like lactoylglutathione lyase family enzyme